MSKILQKTRTVETVSELRALADCYYNLSKLLHKTFIRLIKKPYKIDNPDIIQRTLKIRDEYAEKSADFLIKSAELDPDLDLTHAQHLVREYDSRIEEETWDILEKAGFIKI